MLTEWGSRAHILSRLFISHSSKDSIAAIAFKQWLGATGWSDEDVFLDLDSIGAGERWKEALRVANARCEAVVLLASPDALSSPECVAEVRKAEDFGKEIIVILLHDLQFEDHRLDSYKDRQIVDLAAPPQGHVETVEYRGENQEVRFNAAGLARVKDFLAKRGISPDRFAWPPQDKPNAEPFPGLSAFTESDAGIFFGRDADIVRGLDKLRVLRRNGRPRLLVIQAASGAGKSSYLRAGLWPRLGRDPDFATLAILRPAQGILTGPEGLGRKLAAHLSRPDQPISSGDIHAQLMAPDATNAATDFIQLIVTAAARAREQRRIGDPEARPPAIVIAVDQAEELFGADDKAESDRFLLLLASLMRKEVRGFELYCLFTIRADGAAQVFQTIADLNLEIPDTLPLLPLPQSAYRDVILKPLEVLARRGQRLTLSAALADRLVADSTGADALPLLAFTISHLYREFSTIGSLTLGQYERIGGVAGSINMALKQALAKPGDVPVIPAAKEEQLTLLRTTFIPWLARVDSETGLPMRRPSRLRELPQSSRAMVERLVEARLLVADHRSGSDIVEVAHESLLRQWSALTGWLQADVDNLKLLEDVERAAAQWEHHGRLDAWINHRAERLFQAETLATRKDFQGRFGTTLLDYLAACRAHESPAFRRSGVDLLPLGLERAALDQSRFSWPPSNDLKRAPYRGLRAFETNDGAIFYGRDADLLRALERIRRLTETRASNLLIILGSSGVGKSSFLCAGLWPRLACCPDDFVLLPVIRADAYDVDRGLAASFSDAFDRLGAPVSQERILERLSAGLLSSRELLDEFFCLAKRSVKPNHPTSTIILPIDQIQQLFIGTGNAASFRDLLAEILISDQRILVVATMRSDKYHLLEPDSRLSIATQELFNLPPLRDVELQEIIRRPAEMASVQFEPADAPFELARQAAQGTGTLPLLAFFLEEYWVQMTNRGEKTLSLSPHGLNDVLSERAEVYLAGHRGSEDTIRRVFILKLVAMSEGGEPMRRLARRSEFSEEEWHLVSELADNPYRLLVLERQEGGETGASVAHEAIFRSWPRLRHWLDNEREFLFWKAGVDAAYQEWKRVPERSRTDALLMGLPLAQAESWIAERAEDLSARDREFIALSAARERKLRSRSRRLRALVYVMFISIIVGLVGWINQSLINDQWYWYTVTRPYAAAQIWPYVLTAAQEQTLKARSSFKECAHECPEMIVVPAGSFTMGSAPDEKGRYATEGPQHAVTISKPFAVSKYQLTFTDWDACVAGGGCNAYRPNDQGWGRGQRPAINVNWNDAQQYVAWLSKATGKVYRLLSEAEYEYATRAGTRTAYPWGEDIGRAMANCAKCGGVWDDKRTAPVGSFASNQFGLYDMVGNVWEWTEDCVHNNYDNAPTDGLAWIMGGDCSNRIVRGGSWDSSVVNLRSANRNWLASVFRTPDLGFRVARTLTP